MYCRVEDFDTLARPPAVVRSIFRAIECEKRHTSSAASARVRANSIARAISTRLPDMERSIDSKRLRAIFPILPLDVRSLSESSAESDEYMDA